jgi:NADH-quinone oxidoreductase subunit J
LAVELALFFVFAVPAVLSAAYVVLARNPVYAALSLVGTFCCLAGLYVTLQAYFLAAVQILVYAGAIMVLFLFVVMLLNLGQVELARFRWRIGSLVGAIMGLSVTIGLAILVVMGTSHMSAPDLPAPSAPQVGWEGGRVAAVGEQLFTHYLLPFEIASIVLLIAIIGAVVIARKKRS